MKTSRFGCLNLMPDIPYFIEMKFDKSVIIEI